MFSTGFTSFGVLLLFPLSITFFVLMHSFFLHPDAISPNINEVLSTNPSANKFVSEGTDRPGSLLVNFPTRITDCDSHSPALLKVFLSPHASICSSMTFPPLQNFDRVPVSVSIDFSSNSNRDALFHQIDYDYSCTE